MGNFLGPQTSWATDIGDHDYRALRFSRPTIAGVHDPRKLKGHHHRKEPHNKQKIHKNAHASSSKAKPQQEDELAIVAIDDGEASPRLALDETVAQQDHARAEFLLKQGAKEKVLRAKLQSRLPAITGRLVKEEESTRKELLSLNMRKATTSQYRIDEDRQHADGCAIEDRDFTAWIAACRIKMTVNAEESAKLDIECAKLAGSAAPVAPAQTLFGGSKLFCDSKLFSDGRLFDDNRIFVDNKSFGDSDFFGDSKLLVTADCWRQQVVWQQQFVVSSKP